jgi:hypothetical protein
MYGMVNASVLERIEPVLPQLQSMMAAPDGLNVPQINTRMEAREGYKGLLQNIFLNLSTISSA